MKYTIIYNDSSLNRRKEKDKNFSFDAKDDLEAMQRAVLFQYGEDFDEIEDVRDFLIEEFDDYDDSLSWLKNYLDGVDASGDRVIFAVCSCDDAIYSYF